MTDNPAIQSPRARRAALAACAALILLFGFLSYSAVLTKCATYDEPYHTLAAWTSLRLGDFRMDYPNPPLSFYLAAIANGPQSIHLDTNHPLWRSIPTDNLAAWTLSKEVLYLTSGNDGATFVNRARLAMLVLGIALGVLIAVWSWQLAGSTAALMALILFAFDPNFLAHASLVKNDIAMSLGTLGTFLVAWHVGKRLTVANAVLLALTIALTMNSKFSALVLAPLLCLLLAIRVLMPSPWALLGRTVTSIWRKAAAACLLLILCAIVTYVTTWASYRFRFAAIPDPAVHLDIQMNINELTFLRFNSAHPIPPRTGFDPTKPWEDVVAELAKEIDLLNHAAEEAQKGLTQSSLPPMMRRQLQSNMDDATAIMGTAHAMLDIARQVSRSNDPNLRQTIYREGSIIQRSMHDMDLVQYCLTHPNGESDIFVNLARSMIDHHLMPEAWVNGLMSVYANIATRNNFLLGQTHLNGVWFYFPLAMLFKTPVATLITLGFALIVAARHWRRFPSSVWNAACLILPGATLLALAITSNVNIGLRHILPVYPLLYIGAAVILAPVLRHSHRAHWLAVILGLMLAAETLSAWPDYIPYFNFATLSRFDPIDLLGDSNLDWGQDLPALAKWQKEHGNVPLALSYFGTADPRFYGIVFHQLPPWPPPAQYMGTHVIAISATSLQGSYDDGFRNYRQLQPTEVLNKTIYLYDLRAIR